MSELSQSNPQFSHKWSFQVLEIHLDTFGHMNHATYLQLFEQARWDLITERGYGLNKVLSTQVGPTILELNVRYKRELKLRQTVTIETHNPSVRGKIGKVHQRMWNEKNEIAAEIDLTIGLFDMKERRLINPSAEWLHAIGLN